MILDYVTGIKKAVSNRKRLRYLRINQMLSFYRFPTLALPRSGSKGVFSGCFSHPRRKKLYIKIMFIHLYVKHKSSTRTVMSKSILSWSNLEDLLCQYRDSNPYSSHYYMNFLSSDKHFLNSLTANLLPCEGYMFFAPYWINFSQLLYISL